MLADDGPTLVNMYQFDRHSMRLALGNRVELDVVLFSQLLEAVGNLGYDKNLC